MDSALWPQPQVVVKSSMEEEDQEGKRGIGERKSAKAGKDQILKCPRCNSNNTKFCYYNNYSLSQPRYFCKSCRRYWTAGGSLRNIPVGGASRKNKIRSSSSTPSTSSSPNINNNKIIINSNDIGDHDHDQIQISNNQDHNPIINGNSQQSNVNGSCSSNIDTNSCSWLSSDDHMNQMLRSNGISSPRELIPFMPMPAAAAPQPTSMCTTAGEASGEARRLFFSGSMEDFKQLPTIISTDHQNNGGKLGDVPAFWNGIFGGGSW